jgi:galactonate dehydratase
MTDYGHILIKDAAVSSFRVSNKTVWRHLVLSAAEHVGTGEFTLDPAGPDLDTEAAAMAASLIGRKVGSNFTEELDTLCRRDLQGASIVSAMDQAINDLRARISGLPLVEHLGGQQSERSIPLYANINRRTLDRSPAGFRASAELALGRGFAAVKIAPFDGLRPALCGSRDGDVLLAAGLERIAAARDGLPMTVPLLVDCHWRLTSPVCKQLLPQLSALGVSWFECPLPEERETISELAALRRAANDRGIRMAGCETMTAWEGFRPYVEADAYDVIMPDIKYVGGFDALREVAARAAERNVAVSLHNPTGPICHLHSLHACVALGLTERLEMQFEESPLFETIVHPALPNVAGGEARLPSGSGLGAVLPSPTHLKSLADTAELSG